MIITLPKTGTSWPSIDFCHNFPKYSNHSMLKKKHLKECFSNLLWLSVKFSGNGLLYERASKLATVSLALLTYFSFVFIYSTKSE